MPELPEVETVRLSLIPHICGKKIDNVRVLRDGVLLSNPAMLEGQVITTVERHGKHLQLNLADGGRLLIHLRMTGRLVYGDICPEPEKHTHILIRLLPEGCLSFTDSRRFGRMQQFNAEESLLGTAFAGMDLLGPEPLDVNLSDEYLKSICSRHSRAPIKSILLNQQLIAGLGNIYADEVLSNAAINPLVLAGSLNESDLIRLRTSIRFVISKAIACRGTTLRDYVDGNREAGKFQCELRVYGRKGLPCLQCGTTIESRCVAGRTTCFCPICQKVFSTV
jgi:formamidopyrimidine-DNA glycosylase